MSLKKIKSSGLLPEHSSQLVSDFEKVYFQRLVFTKSHIEELDK